MSSDPSLRRAAAWRVLIVVGTLVLASAARESRGTDLTDSNLLPTEMTPPYATVSVVQKATNVVEFTVTATTTWYSSTGTNFGNTGFTFNTDLPVVANDITFVSPSVGWNKTANPAGNPFGSFSWLVSSTRGAPTLVFDVTHAGATPSHFMIYNIKNAMFTANISNFTVQGSSVTSHWVSNHNAIHLLILAAIVAAALVGLGLWFYYRHRRSKSSTPGVEETRAA